MQTARARERVYYLRDGAGLRLQIRPNGARYWMMRYRIGGKESTFLLGKFPDVGLEQARTEARAASVVMAGAAFLSGTCTTPGGGVAGHREGEMNLKGTTTMKRTSFRYHRRRGGAGRRPIRLHSGANHRTDTERAGRKLPALHEQ